MPPVSLSTHDSYNCYHSTDNHNCNHLHTPSFLYSNAKFFSHLWSRDDWKKMKTSDNLQVLQMKRFLQIKGLWMPPPWKHSRPGWMGLWAPWSRVGGVPAYSKGLELEGLKGPFQPKPFCHSMKCNSRLLNENFPYIFFVFKTETRKQISFKIQMKTFVLVF